MSRYLLSPHSYACMSGNHAVFLDLKRDKYTAVHPEDTVRLRAHVRGWDRMISGSQPEISSSDDTPLITSMLLAEGLITENHVLGKEAGPVDIDPVSATIDDIAGCFPTIDRTDVYRFTRAWALTTLALRFCTLERLTYRVRKRREVRGSNKVLDMLRAHHLMTVYFILRPNFFSAQDACLRDSLTFLEFFAQYDLYPFLVFGVRMNPFAAHSWVQHGPMVLNDYVPHVTKFAPIMVV